MQIMGFFFLTISKLKLGCGQVFPWVGLGLPTLNFLKNYAYRPPLCCFCCLLCSEWFMYIAMCVEKCDKNVSGLPVEATPPQWVVVY